MLILVSGLPGTGKTTVAKSIAKKIRATILRTDVIRKELIKKPIYSKKEIRKIYGEMFSRAKNLLKKNKSVILDAVFSKRVERNKAKKLAKELNTDFKIVEVLCKEEVIKKRIGRRSGDESDANFDIYLMLKKLFEPITEKHIIIDNSKGKENIDRELNKYF